MPMPVSITEISALASTFSTTDRNLSTVWSKFDCIAYKVVKDLDQAASVGFKSCKIGFYVESYFKRFFLGKRRQKLL